MKFFNHNTQTQNQLHRYVLRQWILVLLFSLAITAANAQTIFEISGVIKDSSTQEGIPGVVVMVKGTGSGTSTDAGGAFRFTTSVQLPFTISVSGVGYATKELIVTDRSTQLVIQLHSDNILVNEVVVAASRTAESSLLSPVSIEKIDIRAIREAPQSSFFDAVENLKGVQFTTLSLGFKVPNTRGFGNTTNSRFLQLVDGADNQAPGLGVSIANAVGPTELDILSVELIPGAASALYGMNALNGLSSLRTRNPFVHYGIGFYQKSAINHVDGKDANLSYYNETAFRIASPFNDKWAFKLNASYMIGNDWVANDSTDLNGTANLSTGLIGYNNPGYDGINSYGNESTNRRTLTLSGKKYVVARTGYNEKDLADYSLRNIKFDAGLFYRPIKGTEISYVYRVGTADNIYQRGNRIRLEDYSVQQHKLEFTNANVAARSYFTTENTGRSYNLRPLGENMDRAFKSDNIWFADYTTAWNNALSQGNTVEESHRLARLAADAGKFLPGTSEFEAKKSELAAINNWDKGAALVMKNSLWHNEIQYSFGDSSLLRGFTGGLDQRTYFIEPDGNSFINPVDSGQTLYFSKFGGFVQYTREFFNKSVKLVLSLRADKATYFAPVVNPRAAVVYTLKKEHHFRFSWQTGYRYPTLFEAFSYVDNGGVRRIGGLALMSQEDQIFENSYTRSSVDKFIAAVNADINSGFTQQDAISRNEALLVKSTYSYIKPEKINTFEIGYKALVLKDRLLIDVDGYFNQYDNFIGQVEVVKPNNGSIGTDDSTSWFAYDRTKNKKYRMWTNSLGTVRNHGASIGITWSINRKYTLSGNFTYSEITSVSSEDALIPAFNTPRFTANLSAGNRAITQRLGASVSWRWQDGFYWQSPLADGFIPAYQTLDVQATIQLPKISSHVKLGASNILNHRFTQYTGGPRIGGFYYVSFVFDQPLQLFNKQ